MNNSIRRFRGSAAGSSRAALSGLLCVLTLPAMAALASGQAESPPTQPVKTPSILPDMGDVKTAAPPRLQKSDAPESDIVGPAIALPAKVKMDEAGPDLGQLPPIDRSILYWDQTAEGVIWTRGSTYKASFGPHGATYIPFLGATAPQNYPVTFELQSVSAGGQAVAFDPHVQAVRNGMVVSFDHGPFTLQYVMAIDSMEQVFVFDAPPLADEGDLSIEMTVHSEMSKVQDGGRLVLENELGKVGYTQAIAIDAAGRRETVATTWTAQGDISISVPAAFMAQAAYPLTIDPVINTVAVDTADADNRVPDVAYDQTTDRWLVSYEDQFSAVDGDVFAQTRTRTGGTVAGGGEFIDFTEDNWRNPKCANNNIANQFLVVAQRGDAPTRVIVGRTRNASSITMGPQFVISSAAQRRQVQPGRGRRSGHRAADALLRGVGAGVRRRR